MDETTEASVIVVAVGLTTLLLAVLAYLFM
jgi:hypothetical protein